MVDSWRGPQQKPIRGPLDVDPLIDSMTSLELMMYVQYGNTYPIHSHTQKSTDIAAWWTTILICTQICAPSLVLLSQYIPILMVNVGYIQLCIPILLVLSCYISYLRYTIPIYPNILSQISSCYWLYIPFLWVNVRYSLHDLPMVSGWPRCNAAMAENSSYVEGRHETRKGPH